METFKVSHASDIFSRKREERHPNIHRDKRPSSIHKEHIKIMSHKTSKKRRRRQKSFSFFLQTTTSRSHLPHFSNVYFMKRMKKNTFHVKKGV